MRSTIILILGVFLVAGNVVVAVSQDEEPTETLARPDVEREVEYLSKRLQALLAEEQELTEGNAPQQELAAVHARIARIERELRGLDARQRHGRPDIGDDAERLESATRRIQHIRAAAENLKAAGIDDLADQLLRVAGEMAQEVRSARDRLAEGIKRTQARREGQGLARIIDQLRQEVAALRDEVEELRQQVRRR